MKRRLLVVLAAAVAALVCLTGCSQAMPYVVNKGQTLTVVLEANASTGYSWYAEPGDKAIAFAGDPKYIKDPNVGGMVGTGGRTEITFLAKSTGETTYTLTYKRPWEADIAIKTYKLTLKVRETNAGTVFDSYKLEEIN